MPDRAVIESNIQESGEAMGRYCDQLGYNVPAVLKWQAGMLSRDLIDHTPVAIAAKIRKDVNKKFHTLTESSGLDIAPGKGLVRWYAASHTGLFGIFRDEDLTGASDATIYKTYYETKLNKRGMVKLGQRGKQTIWGWKRITTTKEQALRLADKLVNHAGRLAAGWTVAWYYCNHPGRDLPEKVRRHSDPNKAKGYYVDNLDIPGHPSFTIINNAKGAANLKAKENFLNYALLRRIRLMRNHVTRLLHNPEEAARTVPQEVFG